MVYLQICAQHTCSESRKCISYITQDKGPKGTGKWATSRAGSYITMLRALRKSNYPTGTAGCCYDCTNFPMQGPCSMLLPCDVMQQLSYIWTWYSRSGLLQNTHTLDWWNPGLVKEMAKTSCSKDKSPPLSSQLIFLCQKSSIKFWLPSSLLLLYRFPFSYASVLNHRKTLKIVKSNC